MEEHRLCITYVPPVTDCGWKIENDKLIPILMEREGVPDLGLTVVW